MDASAELPMYYRTYTDIYLVRFVLSLVVLMADKNDNSAAAARDVARTLSSLNAPTSVVANHRSRRASSISTYELFKRNTLLLELAVSL